MINKKTNNKAIVIFKDHPVRRVWLEKEEKWYFSIVDVVGILSQSVNPQNYWKVLKNRLKKEGSEVVTKCNRLKMMASDSKYYLTDAADTEVILRLIQSIPSPNAEPFKLWSEIKKEAKDELSPDFGFRNWGDLSIDDKYKIWKYMELGKKREKKEGSIFLSFPVILLTGKGKASGKDFLCNLVRGISSPQRAIFSRAEEKSFSLR